MHNRHIDVRAPWPILVCGLRTWQLDGFEREEALDFLNTLEEVFDENIDAWVRAYTEETFVNRQLTEQE